MNDDYLKMVSDCAEQGKTLTQGLSNAGIMEALYLYCRKSTETENGALVLVRDSEGKPEDCELVTGEGLRCNVPYSNYFQWVYDRARHAPIMKYGK